MKKFIERYDLPPQSKFYSVITQQQIEVESCSNSL